MAKNDLTQQAQRKAQGDLWKNLAGKAQKGDGKAYNQLLRELSPYIKGYLIPRVANPEWAEDITQDALISVHKALQTYDASKPFKPWMMSIVNFRKTDYLRKHYSARDDQKTSLDDAGFLSTHVTNPEYAGEYRDVEKFLDGLPHKQRVAFELVKIKGYSMAETALELGMSVSAVKVSTHRTLHKLKKALG